MTWLTLQVTLCKSWPESNRTSVSSVCQTNRGNSSTSKRRDLQKEMSAIRLIISLHVWRGPDSKQNRWCHSKTIQPTCSKSTILRTPKLRDTTQANDQKKGVNISYLPSTISIDFSPKNYTVTKAIRVICMPVPAVCPGNFTNRCLRCAFLTWAILVALAVSALMFPKLPDTLGLSEEATGDQGLGGLGTQHPQRGSLSF